MKKMDSAAIRSAFLDYFAQQGHQVVPSSSLVPAQDPTLLFTNAGMVQFKDVFLGTEQRTYQRAASVQRCVRAGGKHNDLENVGFTARHHTFFEMLGNFSFGDYFKKDAIRMAWTFLTEVLSIPKERLWVTVYEEDLESEKIWIDEMGVNPERVTRCGAKDNFWAMGDTGPCGPCTEIYYDHGPAVAGGPPGSPDMDGDRYVEIWNVVFMQFNRDPSGQMHPLPKPSVDTGMGLERIAAVMQGVCSNYDTDIFVHLKQAIAKLSKDIDLNSPSIQVIADHIRACSFLLADGVIPSNEGRGYVLRRIIRRAIRHGQKLNLPSPFMHQLVPAVIEKMGDAYPYLKDKKKLIQDFLKQEEEQFIRTIHQGLKLLQESMATCHHRLLPGDVVFKLYDTYGFPVDLTADAAREAGYQIDMAGFEACMQAQRQQSQSNTQFQTDYLELPTHLQATEFKGYEQTDIHSKVMALLSDGKNTDELIEGQTGILILANTPFYAESGGQVGDEGRIFGPQGEFVVTDTQRKGEMILHMGYVTMGCIKCEDKVHAKVDIDKRQAIRLNHTATHILHAALGNLLGESVSQRGSLVNADRSRFDFSFNRALTHDELNQIESWVNAKIRENQVVETELLSLEKAQAKGAIALFGEKYGEEVRVLSMGEFSQELCGGTHAARTGDIGCFRILSEASIASGVRRMEFATGEYALKTLQAQNQLVTDVANLLKTSPDLLEERITQNQQQVQALQQQLQQYEKKWMLEQARSWVAKQNNPLLIQRVDEYDVKSLRVLSDLVKDLKPEWMIILYSIQADNIHVMVSVPKGLQAQAGSASDWVKILCPRGGGRPDFAQGGGPIPEDLEQKLAMIKEKLNFLA
jgi:alanyl-tRNA synthetase